MNKNLIIIITLFLLIVLASTFLVCMIKIDQLKENQKQARLSSYNTTDNTIKGDTPKFDIEPKYLKFTVYRNDLSEVNLADYEDSPLVILFFNDKNEDSLKNLEMIDGIYKDYEDKINFLMISTNEAANLELESKYSIDIFYDFYKEAVRNYMSRDYNEIEIPTIIYINDSNEVFNTKTGLTTYDALEANLDILSENY